MVSTLCSQRRQRAPNRAAWGPGNGETRAGRQPRGLGGDTGDSHLQLCSHSAGSGLTVPQYKPPALGSCRIYVEACYCSAGILCAGCLLLLACWRQGQVTCVTTPTQRGGGQWRWQPWETGGPVLARKGRVPNGWDWEDAGMSWVRLLKKLKPPFLSLPLLLFPLHFCLPPSHQPFVDT